MDLMDVAYPQAWRTRLVVHGKPARGRKHYTRSGQVPRNSHSRKQAGREREPWLLVASPGLNLDARKLVVDRKLDRGDRTSPGPAPADTGMERSHYRARLPV